jgi:hypothetical protein
MAVASGNQGGGTYQYQNKQQSGVPHDGVGVISGHGASGR